MIHTVPPKFNIVPAKSLALIGDADTTADQKHEDDFIDLVITKLRSYQQYDVKDERQFSRGLNPGHGLFEAEDWQKYLQQTAGTFTMGCTKGDFDCDENEKPAHAVTISKPFYLAKAPATNAQYQQCVDEALCPAFH